MYELWRFSFCLWPRDRPYGAAELALAILADDVLFLPSAQSTPSSPASMKRKEPAERIGGPAALGPPTKRFHADDADDADATAAVDDLLRSMTPVASPEDGASATWRRAVLYLPIPNFIIWMTFVTHYS
jgi:hypothetical protein